MSLDSQFEAKRLRVLGQALEDPAFVDALMMDPQDALERADLPMTDTDANAAQEFVRSMLVAKEQVRPGDETTLSRAVFAPGTRRPADLAATHGDVHGDGTATGTAMSRPARWRGSTRCA